MYTAVMADKLPIFYGKSGLKAGIDPGPKGSALRNTPTAPARSAFGKLGHCLNV
jgi:hypothetical protein